MALPLSIFESVKQVPTVEVARRYLPGLDLRQQGGRHVGRCPFHEDRHPSFVIFRTGWKCFGCQAGGDQVALVARVLNLKPLEAARVLARDFGLPVDDRPPSPEVRRRMEEAQAARERERFFRVQVDLVYGLLAGAHRAIFQHLQTYEDYMELGGLETTALQIEQILDELLSGDPERQRAALKDVAGWCAAW